MPVSGQSLTRLPLPDAFMPSIQSPGLLLSCLLATAFSVTLLPAHARQATATADTGAGLEAAVGTQVMGAQVSGAPATDAASAGATSALAALPAGDGGRGRAVDARQLREQQRSQAQAALNRNHPARALAIAEAALAQAPGDARLRFLKGVALNQLGRLDEAEDVFRALIDEYPELPDPYNNLAVVLAAQGRLEDARQALEAAIQAVPNHALAHENLGNLYLQLARRNWQRAAALAPANTALARKLKRLETLDPEQAGQTSGQRTPATLPSTPSPRQR